MISNTMIREISPTTKRLVERCLSGDWCVQLVELRRGTKRSQSPSSDGSSTLSPPANITLMPIGSFSAGKSLKQSKSVENLTSARFDPPKLTLRSPLDQIFRPSNASVASLPALATSSKNGSNITHKKRSTTLGQDVSYSFQHNGSPGHIPSSISESIKTISDDSASLISKPHRRPPPAPPKRRKPPAIPIGRTNGGAVITSIRSSEPSPLSKAYKPPVGISSS